MSSSLNTKISKVLFIESLNAKSTLPAGIDFEHCILIYDQVLHLEYAKWIGKFKRRLRVRSGETLKDLQYFSSYMQKISQLSSGVPRQDLTIVAFGGGSVGDFAGFVASIFKRGVRLVQMPSTWLAAIDSAHGGKTALNVNGVKNQVGSFYPAAFVVLVKQVFLNLPNARVHEVLGEYYKIGLLQGGKLWQNICQISDVDGLSLWRLLPKLISAKMKIVQQDPYENKAVRQILNLGHTIGHVLEAKLHLPHGVAINFGLRFTYEFGKQLGIGSDIPKLERLLPSKLKLAEQLKKVRSYEKILRADKKLIEQQKINFIFVQRPGKVLVRAISIEEISVEWKRQLQQKSTR